ELLPRTERVRGEMVPLLELPDALARVAGVRPGGDRPERVGRPNDVRALRSGTVGAAGDEPDGEGGEYGDDKELHEHVFAIVRRTRVRVKWTLGLPLLALSRLDLALRLGRLRLGRCAERQPSGHPGSARGAALREERRDGGVCRL